MTEAEWLAARSTDKLFRHLTGIGHARLVRRTASLFSVACVRATNVNGNKRSLWNAVRAVERAAETGDWYEVDALFVSSGIPRGKSTRSAEYYWGLAANWLTGSHSLWSLNDVPRFLLSAVSKSTTRSTRGLHRTFADLLRDVIGNSFRPVTFDPGWRTDTVVALARQMYESREFEAMPILADALQDAGCDSDDILNHCRGPGPHVRGCWVVDLVLGKV